MTVPSVGASHFVHCCGIDGISEMVDYVVSKLNLKPEDKQKYRNEICREIVESVNPALSHFSTDAASAIRAGEATHILLFLIIASYAGGNKIKDSFPEFIADLFKNEDKVEIEEDRKLIQEVGYSRFSFFSLEGGGELSLESFHDWTGLSVKSSNEEIAAAFLRHNLRPVRRPKEGTGYFYKPDKRHEETAL